MTELFKRFQDTLKGLLAKKPELEKQIRVNEGYIHKYNEALDLAELNGEKKNVAELRKSIEELEVMTAGLRTTLRAYNRDPDSLIAYFRQNNKDLHAMATQIKVDNLNEIKRLQGQYDEDHQKLMKVKAEYLDLISKLGSAYIQAQDLAQEIKDIKSFIPGEIPGTYYGGLKTDLDDLTHESRIYLNDVAVNMAFCNGQRLDIIWNR